MRLYGTAGARRGLFETAADVMSAWIKVEKPSPEVAPINLGRCGRTAVPGLYAVVYKNSSGDEIANVDFLTTISHTPRSTSKYRKRDKPTSSNQLDDR